jgi:hypothetical protein
MRAGYFEDSLVADSQSPDEAVLLLERKHQLCTMWEFLAPIERDILRSHYFENEPLKDIAKRWGMADNGTINHMVRRTLARLRKWMEQGYPSKRGSFPSLRWKLDNAVDVTSEGFWIATMTSSYGGKRCVYFDPRTRKITGVDEGAPWPMVYEARDALCQLAASRSKESA